MLTWPSGTCQLVHVASGNLKRLVVWRFVAPLFERRVLETGSGVQAHQTARHGEYSTDGWKSTKQDKEPAHLAAHCFGMARGTHVPWCCRCAKNAGQTNNGRCSQEAGWWIEPNTNGA